MPDIAANRALAREQLAVIDGALSSLHELDQNGQIHHDDPRFSLWGRRRIEPPRQTGAGKAEIIAALDRTEKASSGGSRDSGASLNDSDGPLEKISLSEPKEP